MKAIPLETGRGARGWLLVTALMLSLLAYVGDAWAQPVDAAEEAFHEGTRALRDHRSGDAIRALERSYALRSQPEVLYNLGLAYRIVGRNMAAIDAYTRYLHGPGPGVAVEILNQLQLEVERLRGTLVTVTLENAPQSLAVQVDGHGQTLAGRALTLDPGTHVVELSAPGFEPQRQEMTFSPGSSEVVHVDLQPVRVEAARLVVEPSVDRATVTIDGTPAGIGHVERRLGEGDHVVEVRASGHVAFRRSVHVGVTGMIRLPVTLNPERRPWVVPTLVAGGVVIVAGAVLGVLWFNRERTVENGTLGTYYEALRSY